MISGATSLAAFFKPFLSVVMLLSVSSLLEGRSLVSTAEAAFLRLKSQAGARSRATARAKLGVRRMPPGGWSKAFSTLAKAREAQNRSAEEANLMTSAGHLGAVLSPDESETAHTMVMAKLPEPEPQGLVPHAAAAAVVAEVDRDVQQLSADFIMGSAADSAAATALASGNSEAAAPRRPLLSGSTGAGRKGERAASKTASLPSSVTAAAAASSAAKKAGSVVSPGAGTKSGKDVTAKRAKPGAGPSAGGGAVALGGPVDVGDVEPPQGVADLVADPFELEEDTAEVNALSDRPLVNMSADWATEQLSANRELKAKVNALLAKNTKIGDAASRLKIALQKENTTAKNWQALQDDLSTATIKGMEDRLTAEQKPLPNLKTSLVLKDHRVEELQAEISNIAENVSETSAETKRLRRILADDDSGLFVTKGNLTYARKQGVKLRSTLELLASRYKSVTRVLMSKGRRTQLERDLAEEKVRDQVLSQQQLQRAADAERMRKAVLKREQKLNLTAARLLVESKEVVKGRREKEEELEVLEQKVSLEKAAVQASKRDIQGRVVQLKGLRKLSKQLELKNEEMDRLRAAAEGLSKGVQEAKAASLFSTSTRLDLRLKSEERQVGAQEAKTEDLKATNNAWRRKLEEAEKVVSELENRVRQAKAAMKAGDWADVRNPKLRKELLQETKVVGELGAKNAKLKLRTIPALRKKLRHLQKRSAKAKQDLAAYRNDLPRLLGWARTRQATATDAQEGVEGGVGS